MVDHRSEAENIQDEVGLSCTESKKVIKDKWVMSKGYRNYDKKVSIKQRWHNFKHKKEK